MVTDLATRGPDTVALWSPYCPVAPDQHPALVYLATLDERHSQGAMGYALNGVAAIIAEMSGMTTRVYEIERPTARRGLRKKRVDCTFLDVPWERLRFQHVAALRAKIKARYGTAAGNRMLAALRGVLKAALQLELMTADEYRRCVDATQRIKGEARPGAAGRAIAQDEFEKMLEAALASTRVEGWLGLRDATILALLWVTGMRRGEVARLAVGDFDAATGTLLIRKGKGNKTRVAPVGAARPLLEEWLTRRAEYGAVLAWEAEHPGLPAALFPSLEDGSFMTPTAIYYRVKTWAAAAGVEDLTCHDFRRTVAGDLLDAGSDLVAVRDLLGHASTQTTAGYDRRGLRAVEAAAAKRVVGYERWQREEGGRGKAEEAD